MQPRISSRYVTVPDSRNIVNSTLETIIPLPPTQSISPVLRMHRFDPSLNENKEAAPRRHHHVTVLIMMALRRTNIVFVRQHDSERKRE
jgi:hypothetical protein